LPERPFIDLTSSYVLRAVDDFPRQGDREPWRLYQNYIRDLRLLRRRPIEDEALEFTRGGRRDRAKTQERPELAAS
jgi:hypothetical protein